MPCPRIASRIFCAWCMSGVISNYSSEQAEGTILKGYKPRRKATALWFVPHVLSLDETSLMIWRMPLNLYSMFILLFW